MGTNADFLRKMDTRALRSSGLYYSVPPEGLVFFEFEIPRNETPTVIFDIDGTIAYTPLKRKKHVTINLY